MTVRRIDVLGVPVDCVTMAQSLDIVDDLVSGQKCQTILAVNPEKVMRAQSDPVLLSSLRAAKLLIPDGIGVVMAARILALGKLERVPGVELMQELCRRAPSRGYRIFLFGATLEANEIAKQVLTERYPGIRIVGHQHGFVKEHEMPALIDRINEARTQILFVGLGSPKQEIWMEQYRAQLKVNACQGVGGTFDVIAGRVPRAPQAFRTLNMEWLYRLLIEPRRLLRQSSLLRFALQVLRERASG